MTDQPTTRNTSRSDFPAVVHTYTDALRILRERGASSPAEIANLTERVLSNVRRDLPKLEAAGVVIIAGADNAPLIDITDKGLKWVAGQDVAEGLTDEPGSSTAGTGLIAALHFEMRPDPEQARKDWDSDEAKADFAALKQSLRDKRLKQNLIIRLNHEDDGPDAFGTEPQANRFIIVAGERRWRAIGELIEEGHWPADKPIPAMLEDGTPAEIRAVSLIENLLRRNLNPIEKANGYTELAAQLVRDGMEEGKVNGHIAALISKTPEHVQQTRRLLLLDAADQERMTLGKDDPRRLTLREARQKLAKKDEPKPAAPTLNVSPAARLVLAEVLHRVRSETYTWGDIIVGAAAVDDPHLAELVGCNQLKAAEMEKYGDDAGHFSMSLGYGITWSVFSWDHTQDTAARDAGLRAEQAAAAEAAGVTLDLNSQTYATAWLNGPFELTAEGEAVVAERDRVSAENEATEAKAEQERNALKAAHAAVAARARDVFEQNRATLPQPDLLKEVADLAESPLPWRLTHNGGVIAANNNLVITGNSRNDRGEARMRMMVLAVNGAAGFGTPEDEPDPNGTALSKAEFVGMMAAEVEARQPELAPDLSVELAESILSDLGYAFGEEGFAWTREGAVAVVGHHYDAAANADQDEAVA